MIDNTGAIDYSFAWDWGDATTEVRDSCSVQYEGEMWIFGGFNNLRQIARVNGCHGIEQRQEQLDFDFHSQLFSTSTRALAHPIRSCLRSAR